MEINACYQSPLGYTTGDTKIDGYGVDHSDFTVRDEIEYQLFRQEEENRRIKEYNKRGMMGNYPQGGPDFWGNPENNYGFGHSNIHNNIEHLKNIQYIKEMGLTGNHLPIENDTLDIFKKNFLNDTIQHGEDIDMMSYYPADNNHQGKENYEIQHQHQSYKADQKNSYLNSMNNPRNFKRGTMLDVATDGLKGFGMGVENGLLYALNAMLQGSLDIISTERFDNIYEKKQRELDNQIYGYNSPKVNKLYKYSKYLIDNTAGKMPIAQFLKDAKEGYNYYKKII